MADQRKNIDFQSVDDGLSMPVRPTDEVFFVPFAGDSRKSVFCVEGCLPLLLLLGE
jgi:hypothetical protein